MAAEAQTRLADTHVRTIGSGSCPRDGARHKAQAEHREGAVEMKGNSSASPQNCHVQLCELAFPSAGGHVGVGPVRLLFS